MRGVVWIINRYDAGKFPEDVGFKAINLASNENPYPPSDEVKEAYSKALSSINRYPHPEYLDLKRAIAEYLDVDESKITVGNGASEVLNNICVALLDTFDKVVIPIPSYTLYAILAMLRDASIEYVEFLNYKVKADEIPPLNFYFYARQTTLLETLLKKRRLRGFWRGAITLLLTKLTLNTATRALLI